MNKQPLLRRASLVLFLLFLAACQSAAPGLTATTPPTAIPTTIPPTATVTPLPPTATFTLTPTNTPTPIPPTPTETLTPTPTPVMPVKGVTYKSETVDGVTIWFRVDDTGTKINGLYVKLATGEAFFYLTDEKLAVPILDGRFQVDKLGGTKTFLLQAQFDTPTTASGRLEMKVNSLMAPPVDITFVAKAQEANKPSATPTK